MKLGEVSFGSVVKIVRVDLKTRLVEYASSRGIFVGNKIKIIRSRGGRILAEIDSSVYILPQNITKFIVVELV